MATNKPKKSIPLSTKPSDWRVAQKYIRIAHNKAVVGYFKDVPVTDKGTTNIKNSTLIYKQDSATQCLIKMKFFEQYIEYYSSINPVLPEYWQVKKGANVPQLVVIFKPKNPTTQNKNSRWSLSLPHFSSKPQKAELLKNKGYRKGSYQGMVTLKDNSKIIIYAESIAHAEQTLKNWISLKVFDSKYLNSSDYDIKVGKIKNKFQEVEIKPAYCKYFSKGQQNLKPDWTLFLDDKAFK
jgi:hypothetical protein